MPSRQTFFIDDCSRFNSGIYHKFYDQNKKKCISSAGMFVFADNWRKVCYQNAEKDFSAVFANRSELST